MSSLTRKLFGVRSNSSLKQAAGYDPSPKSGRTSLIGGLRNKSKGKKTTITKTGAI